jgi:hypothetical protein
MHMLVAFKGVLTLDVVSVIYAVNTDVVIFGEMSMLQIRVNKLLESNHVLTPLGQCQASGSRPWQQK